MKFVVHGHFYQPFRENPYVGDIMLEDTAYPYENWNERIHRECYLPNAYAHYRVNTKVRGIINNYKKISFNVGWTLLQWMEKKHPETLEKIMEGSENALATSFNHTILPLDPEEDKEIQVFWGIRAFEKFFGKKPTGFWLPELAVDKETVNILIKYGIKYSILAPHQAKVKDNFFRYYTEKGHMDFFIYDGELSHGVAFGDLLSDAKTLLEKLKQRKDLTLIATDGETFGHHKKFGEMGLAYMFFNSSDFTTLEAFYREHSPKLSGDINWNTSWSCPHGVERWRSNCGCSSGGLPGWHQKWRKPLRDGLEVIRSKLKEITLNELEKYFLEPERAILNFIDIILGGSKEDYLRNHAKKRLSGEERTKVFSLLNALKYIQLSFSSDGWFFAELSGIETVKNILFAKRAMELVGDPNMEKTFLRYLEEAPSNVQAYGNGLGVWKKLVLPQVYETKSIARCVLLFHLSDLNEEKGSFGKWEFEIAKQGIFKIKLFDKETDETFLLEEDLKDFDMSQLPSLCCKKLLEKWSMDYIEAEIEFFKDYERLLEDLVSHSKSLRLDMADYMRKKLEISLKLKLIRSFLKGEEFGRIKEVFKKANELSVDIVDENVSRLFSQYIKKNIPSLSEGELIELLDFVKEYNRSVSKYNHMVGLWEVQNWVWERKETIKDRRVFDLLNLEVMV